MFLIGLAAVYGAGLYRYLDLDVLHASVEDSREQARRHLVATMTVFFVAYVGLTMLSLPVSGLLSILCGALFDRWLGNGLASLSAAAGAVLAFLSSRYLFHDWVRQRFGHRLEAIDRGVRRDGASTCSVCD